MKTFLAIIVIALSLGGCEGIRQSNDNEPSATYRPLPQTANRPGINYAFAPMALAEKEKRSDDYWQFEKWLQYLHKEAPRHHLKLQWGEPTQEEFFYLYCWQSSDHSITHAIQKAKEVSDQRDLKLRSLILRDIAADEVNEAKALRAMR